MAIDFAIGKNIDEALVSKKFASYCEETVGAFLYSNRKYFSEQTEAMLCRVDNTKDTYYDENDIYLLKEASLEIQITLKNERFDGEVVEETLYFLNRLVLICDEAINNNMKIIAVID